MRLLKRNLRPIEYLAYNGKQEVLRDGKHTGKYEVTYATPVSMYANVNVPSGFASTKMFGEEVRYTHIALFADPNVGIEETGRILWNGNTYLIKAVRHGMSQTTVALERVVGNEATST